MRFIAMVIVAALGVWLVFEMTPRGQGTSSRVLMPGAQARLTELVFGCERSHHKRLDDFVLAQDRAAFGAYLDDQVRRGGCTELPAGTVLQIEEVKVFAGATRVRQRGASKSWWVTTASLVQVAAETQSGRAH